jgi:hypothetical protein
MYSTQGGVAHVDRDKGSMLEGKGAGVGDTSDG